MPHLTSPLPEFGTSANETQESFNLRQVSATFKGCDVPCRDIKITALLQHFTSQTGCNSTQNNQCGVLIPWIRSENARRILKFCGLLNIISQDKP